MKIRNLSIHDIDTSIRASKYPMALHTEKISKEITSTVIALALSKKGEGHDQFLSGITIAFDLTCTNKMWIEMERYKFVTFVSSQSTMHKAAKFNIAEQCNKYVDGQIIRRLEELQTKYNDVNSKENYLKLLYNIPSGFELTARLTTNYRALKTIYAQRKDHRLPEWREFCEWIETLPLAEQLITGKLEPKVDTKTVTQNKVEEREI